LCFTNDVPPGKLPVLGFATPGGWDSWLAEQHAVSPGVWLKIPRAGSAEPGVRYADALAVALCYGWIDGQKRRLDDDYWLQRFTPRKPRSRWSKINTEKATELIEAGRMRPAGMREVEQARADGRWNAAYAGQRTMAVPDDLAAELARNDAARAFFERLSGVNRYAILYRIGDAKRPETRAKRIAKYVAMLAAGETIHPQTRPGSPQTRPASPQT
jgi:uncharacterized protein YdeI (YjbR/CyaY-like superfamily)